MGDGAFAPPQSRPADEIGTDMSRFPTAGHLRAWAGMCPRQPESAGKHRSRQSVVVLKSRRADRACRAFG